MGTVASAGGLAFAAVAAFYQLDTLSGVIAVLLGAGIGAQAIDGVRTGYVIGRFPNNWPVDASRGDEPFTFWVTVVTYGATGLLFVVLGVGLLLGR